MELIKYRCLRENSEKLEYGIASVFGVVIKETDLAVFIASSIGTFGVKNVEIIPKSLIIKRENLKTESQKDYNDFIKAYNTLTIPNVAKKYGTTISIVNQHISKLSKNGVLKRKYNRNWKILEEHPEFKERYFGLDIDYIIDKYTSNKPLKYIADKLQVPYSRVYIVVNRLIEDKKLKKHSNSTQRKYDYEAIKQDRKNGLKLREIQEKWGMAHSTLSKILSNYQGDKKGCKTDREIASIDIELFIKNYPKMSIKKMMKEYSVGEAAIRKLTKRLLAEGKIQKKKCWPNMVDS